MSTRNRINRNSGISIIEALLAIAVFGVLAAGTLSLVWEPLTAAGTTDERTRAMFLAQEGIDAARAIRNDEWKVAADGAHGIDKTSGKWVFSGTSDVDGIYTRVVTVDPVNRDGSGDIVTSGGTVDVRTKKVTSTITWNSIFGGNKSLSYETYLTNWNTYDWTETTDSDFNAGALTSAVVQGTGDAAEVTLATAATGKVWELHGSGTTVTQTSDTDFNAGTLSDTVVTGT